MRGKEDVDVEGELRGKEEKEVKVVAAVRKCSESGIIDEMLVSR